MHQHLHTALRPAPLDDVPQRWRFCLRYSLEKDPSPPLQNQRAAEGDAMITTLSMADRTITHPALATDCLTDLTSVTRRPSTRRGPEKSPWPDCRSPPARCGRRRTLRLDAAGQIHRSMSLPHRCLAGVGKVHTRNHWLPTDGYRNISFCGAYFGWSSTRQAAVGLFVREEFLDAALIVWRSDPRIGTAWKKGETILEQRL